MRPQTSVATCFRYEIPIGEQMQLVAKAGFTHVSLSAKAEHSGLLTETGRTRLRSLLRTYGLGIDTIHGPGLDGPDACRRLRDVLEAADALEVRRVVVHPGPFMCDAQALADKRDTIVRACGRTLRLTERYDIILAMENVCPGPATDLVIELGGQFSTPYLGFCYDSSHDQIDGPRPFDLLETMGERLVAVHLSDRIGPFVDHVIPGEGFIDWDGLCDRLRAARLERPVLMEVMMQHSRWQDPAAFLNAAHDAAVGIWRAVHDG